MRVDVIHLVRIWPILHVNILEEAIQIYHDSELILIWELLAPLQPVLVAGKSVFQWRHNAVWVTAKDVTEDFCDSLQFLIISNKNANAITWKILHHMLFGEFHITSLKTISN